MKEDVIHFCQENSAEIVARQMSKDIDTITELTKRNEFLSSLCILAVAEGWTLPEVIQELSAPVAQLEEARDLKSLQCRFKSDRAYQTQRPGKQNVH